MDKVESPTGEVGDAKNCVTTTERDFDTFFSLDRQWQVVYASPGARHLFARDLNEVTGQNLWQIAPHLTGCLFEERLRQAMAAIREDRFETYPAGGGLPWVHHVFPAAEGLCVHSHRRRDRPGSGEHEQGSAEREELARGEIDRAHRLKDEFLATLSHELRSPLNAVLGWASLLRMSVPTAEELNHGLETIERNARLQAQRIDDLLDMNRVLSGNMQLDVAWVEVGTIVRAALQSVHFAASAKGIVVSSSWGKGPLTIQADAVRLQQIVWNLLFNAIKFTPRGGTVEIAVERQAQQVRIGVRDNGQGVDHEFLPFVFDCFRQSDASLTRQHGGLGLGLALVQHLVQLHGGTITAHSAGVGKGMTMEVLLPVAATPSALPAAEPRREPKPAVAGTKLDRLDDVKVLVVDDEEDSRELMQRILEECRASVQTAASGTAAVEWLSQWHPDVLVSDISMPDEDGYELIRRVRNLPDRTVCKTPAVAVTAMVRPEDSERALLAGYQAHLSKPVSASALVTTVAQLAR